jgi:hypothetical protein
MALDCYSECHYKPFTLSVIMLRVVMLSVITLNVVMLSVVALKTNITAFLIFA